MEVWHSLDDEGMYYYPLEHTVGRVKNLKYSEECEEWMIPMWVEGEAETKKVVTI
jgi:hypothetical protein